jgi:hypothetical protein
MRDEIGENGVAAGKGVLRITKKCWTHNQDMDDSPF